MVQEVHPFDRRFYSHKFKSAGVRYEVAVAIHSGDIVWINGPFKAGQWPDIRIFRRGLMRMLEPGEMVEADAGYRGEINRVRIPTQYSSIAERQAKALARARHETINTLFKNWGITKTRFRHPLRRHQPAFKAIVCLTQMGFNAGNKPFQVVY